MFAVGVARADVQRGQLEQIAESAKINQTSGTGVVSAGGRDRGFRVEGDGLRAEDKIAGTVSHSAGQGTKDPHRDDGSERDHPRETYGVLVRNLRSCVIFKNTHC